VLAGRVKRSVVSVRLFPLYLLHQLTFDFGTLHVYGSVAALWGLKEQVRVSKDGNAVGLTSILDRGSFSSY